KRTEEGGVYTYFRRFVDISQKTGVKWSHWDLLFFRETKQRYIDKLIKKDYGIDFIKEQLEISKRIISMSRPKIIVVSNTKARRFMRNKKSRLYMGSEFEFDEGLGTYIIINDDVLAGTPVFFTSMLTGQRALDNGSYERLVWHINFVLEKTNR